MNKIIFVEYQPFDAKTRISVINEHGETIEVAQVTSLLSQELGNNVVLFADRHNTTKVAIHAPKNFYQGIKEYIEFCDKDTYGKKTLEIGAV